MQHDYKAFPNRAQAREIASAFPSQTAVFNHGGIDLLVPKFSNRHGLYLSPEAASLPLDDLKHKPVIRDIGTAWDIAKHADARTPVVLGRLSDAERAEFVKPVARYTEHVLDMPIKFPGTDIRVPVDLASFAPVIQRIVGMERALNPDYDRYYAYLSIHQGLVIPGERQRETPYHVDGFQGPRWTEKHPANHSYLLTDALPTVFYPVDFPLDHIDPNFDDIYAEFAMRIDADPGIKTWMPKPLEIMLMDCYCVHRGQPAIEPTFRTWLRISWETRIFDRLGNAHNPLFDYNWPMLARDTDPRIRPRIAA